MAQKAKVIGLPSLKISKPFCSACQLGKQCRVQIPSTARRAACQLAENDSICESGATHATQPLSLIYTDLCGPLSTPSSSGSRYILTLTDDFSRFTWIYFLKHKSDTLTKFKHFKSMAELHHNSKIKALRSGHKGGEYISRDFAQFCANYKITRQFTQAHILHQNIVAERKNRRLLEKARSMAQDIGLPAHLWSEAVSTTTT